MGKYSTVIATSLLALTISGVNPTLAQEGTHQEYLRGTITPERAWWDITYYHLDISVDVNTCEIQGTNTMTYKVIDEKKRMQVELQAPLKLTKVTQNGKTLDVSQDGYSYFITLSEDQPLGETREVIMEYGGHPHIAKNAPWDGGVVCSKDMNGKPFIATAVQGDGASLWWPNKDHAYDEPDDGMLMSIEVSDEVMDVSNGRLIGVDEHPDRGTKTYHWKVVNPINNYGVNINIGDYVHFNEIYEGENGPLTMDYYVLRDNLTKAKEQFKQAPQTIKAFEHWFGPYPFYEDGYKLVEVPYLGMEHQSSVTYGNKYANGYLGRDGSGTGWGLKWDFIIVHESGHEWFANNITYKDVADMWIHESFTNYAENLFIEYYYGKKAGHEYVRGTRQGIQNDSPIIGTYGLHREGSGDMYVKGGNMLHTIRQVVNDDALWRETLRGLNETFHNKTVDSADIENYMSRKTGKDLDAIFDQYLRDVRVPRLEYFVRGDKMRVRWSNTVPAFKMPIKITVNGIERWISPTTSWSNVDIEEMDPMIRVDPNFYVSVLDIL